MHHKIFIYYKIIDKCVLTNAVMKCMILKKKGINKKQIILTEEKLCK